MAHGSYADLQRAGFNMVELKHIVQDKSSYVDEKAETASDEAQQQSESASPSAPVAGAENGSVIAEVSKDKKAAESADDSEARLAAGKKLVQDEERARGLNRLSE